MADTHNSGNPQGMGQQPRMGGGLGDRGGVGETLRQAASNVGDVAGQAKEKVEDMASTVVNRLEGAWESTERGVRQGAQAVAETAEDFWGSTTTMIRRYPVASLMVAFGAGCLLASLFSAPRWTDDMARRMSRSS